MEEPGFWRIIEEARERAGGSANAVARELVTTLGGGPVQEIVGFGTVFDRLQRESYRWDLWAAAYLIRGGCSDDGFDDFRGWLVAQGREVWQAALADPDSLAGTAGLATGGGGAALAEGEDMLYAASRAYERFTGSRVAPWAVRSASALPPDGPAGEELDFESEQEMQTRFPRLSALGRTAASDPSHRSDPSNPSQPTGAPSTSDTPAPSDAMPAPAAPDAPDAPPPTGRSLRQALGLGRRRRRT